MCGLKYTASTQTNNSVCFPLSVIHFQAFKRINTRLHVSRLVSVEPSCENRGLGQSESRDFTSALEQPSLGLLGKRHCCQQKSAAVIDLETKLTAAVCCAGSVVGVLFLLCESYGDSE
jgi:hypothetical protein